MNELYHHGIKGQKHGVRNGPPYPLDRKVSAAIKSLKSTAKKSAKAMIGADIKPLNTLTRSNPKLRKLYLDMQLAGIKYKDGKFRYKKSNPESQRLQRNMIAKSKRYVQQYIKEYKKAPLSYKQSLNAQKGAIAGAVAGAVLPLVGGWMTIPAGYIIGANKK